jgi:hypothetical protein
LGQGALVNQIRSIYRLIAHQKSLNCNLVARLAGRRYFSCQTALPRLCQRWLNGCEADGATLLRVREVLPSGSFLPDP